MNPKTAQTIDQLQRFLRRWRRHNDPLSAVSLFSGCGLSDLGYELAGFEMAAQVEKESARAVIGARNFPHSQWITNEVHRVIDDVSEAVRETGQPLDLLVATPPCQGMSSSNPSRGKRKSADARRHASKNRLALQVIPFIKRLKPRVVILENVRQLLTHVVWRSGRDFTVPEFFASELPEYEVFSGVVNVADYGIPQDRRRAVVVLASKEEGWVDQLRKKNLLPWPKPTHSSTGQGDLRKWTTVRQWLRAMKYESLDASSPEAAKAREPLHFVPWYDEDRYLLVSEIPAYSGRNAYANDVCPDCGSAGIPSNSAKCSHCGGVMRNRPIVGDNGEVRLIKGFASSYRRMHPDRPASTVTTNSSHIGSDNKIHPWEHRVMSILECADLQTIPRSFDWSPALEKQRFYLIRNLIGEALPPYFTFLHGQALRKLLTNKRGALAGLAKSKR